MSASEANWLAKPKSVITRLSWLSSSRFSSFRSLCTSPDACMYETATESSQPGARGGTADQLAHKPASRVLGEPATLLDVVEQLPALDVVEHDGQLAGQMQKLLQLDNVRVVQPLPHTRVRAAASQGLTERIRISRRARKILAVS